MATDRHAFPTAITVAVSRETGAHGGRIADRVGSKLGWPVFGQDLLEVLAAEGPTRDQFLAEVPDAARAWADARCLAQSRQMPVLESPDGPRELIHMIWLLAARGESVIVGRGAGFFLPPESTLHVRIVASPLERVGSMSQWQRLTEEEAANLVRDRDRKRAEQITALFQKTSSDLYQYDLVLNSGRLGDEACADLIVQATKAKQEARLERERMIEMRE